MPSKTKNTKKSKVSSAKKQSLSKTTQLFIAVVVAVLAVGTGWFLWQKSQTDELRAHAQAKNVYEIYSAKGGQYAINACRKPNRNLVFIFKAPAYRSQDTRSFVHNTVSPAKHGTQWWGGVVNAIEYDPSIRPFIHVGFDEEYPKDKWSLLYLDVIHLPSLKAPACVYE